MVLTQYWKNPVPFFMNQSLQQKEHCKLLILSKVFTPEMVIRFRTAMTLALRSCRYTYVIVVRKRKEQYNFVSEWCRNFQQKGAFHFPLVFLSKPFSFAFHPWIEFPLPPLQTHYATAVCISFRFLCILYLRRRRSWNGFIAFTEKTTTIEWNTHEFLKHAIFGRGAPISIPLTSF